MHIIRRIRPCPTAYGVLPGCVGCGWVWSCGAASWAVWKLLFDSRTVTFTQCTQLMTQLHKTIAYTPRQNTTCCRTRSYSPDDGHNGVRNILRRKLDNKHRISCILLVLSLHLMFTMHGHKNLKYETCWRICWTELLYMVCVCVCAFVGLIIKNINVIIRRFVLILQTDGSFYQTRVYTDLHLLILIQL